MEKIEDNIESRQRLFFATEKLLDTMTHEMLFQLEYAFSNGFPMLCPG